MLALTHVVRSTGINWGQALAVWIPIVLGIFGLGGLIYRGIRKIAEDVVRSFAAGLDLKFKDVDDHLKRQDERFDRIDRTLKKDTR